MLWRTQNGVLAGNLHGHAASQEQACGTSELMSPHVSPLDHTQLFSHHFTGSPQPPGLVIVFRANGPSHVDCLQHVLMSVGMNLPMEVDLLFASSFQWHSGLHVMFRHCCDARWTECCLLATASVISTNSTPQYWFGTGSWPISVVEMAAALLSTIYSDVHISRINLTQNCWMHSLKTLPKRTPFCVW